MSNDDPAVFDPNIWYQLSELRVDKGGQDLSHNLVYRDEAPIFAVFPDDGSNYWQFVPVNDDIENRWFIRSQKTGIDFHLSSCYRSDEVHEGKTGLCMNQAEEDAEAQMWESYKWNDGTTGVRFINVDNGTDWWLDCHKGSPVFLNDDIDTGKFQVAQRWLVSTVSPVEEASFKVGDGRPTATAEDTGPTSDIAESGQEADGADGGGGDGGGDDGGSSGLSTGASAGIGVGVGVAVLGIVAAIFFLLRRRKQKNARAGAAEMAHSDADKGGATAPPVYEAPTHDTGAREIEGFTVAPVQMKPSELDATGTFSPSPYSEYPIKTSPPESAVSPFSSEGGIVAPHHDLKKR